MGEEAGEEKEWRPKIETQEFERLDLQGMKGVVIRQEAQCLECCLHSFGLICYEQQNNYPMAALPEDKWALRTLTDKTGWFPEDKELEGLTYNMTGSEKSSCCVRCFTSILCCPNYRPFKMQYFMDNGEYMGLEYKKEFTLGGICCSPHKLEVRLNGKYVGAIEENWNVSNWCNQFFEYILCCNVPYRLKLAVGDHEFENRYDINVAFCFWGPHNNCCGSTPCRNNVLFEAYKDKGDKVEYEEAVAFIQKTYGAKGGCKSLTRWLCCKADNYIVEWPETSKVEERALFLGAAILIDYIFYENRRL